MNKTQNSEKDVVQVAGRGVIYITFAKLWFMLTGWALIFGLPRIFKWASGGDAEGDKFVQVENISGSPNGDVLIGDAGNNVIYGNDGRFPNRPSRSR